MTIARFRKVVDIALILSLLVVMLGAYTRLTNAGLGCPDWPGCYGHLIVQQPAPDQVLSATQAQYGIAPLESRKAWTEMAHRYAAGTLALLIFFIGVQAVKRRCKGEIRTCFFPVFLMLLVIFQALLGMWTVTMKLLPIVVMAHLLGGILIFSCLCCFRWQLSAHCKVGLARWRLAIGLALLMVFCQIALGGWVSANYAGIACVGFPMCNGQWVPSLHFAEGFNLFSPVGQNYQGGVLENATRVTIQVIHRLGAVLTLSYLLVLGGLLLKKITDSRIRWFAVVLLCVVVMQFCLGVFNVVFRLPLAVAVLHNGFAALLMAMVLVLFCATRESSLA